MTNSSRLVCSITAFIFLALFVSVEYLPATWVLQLYIIFTHELAIIEMIGLIPVMIFISMKAKDFGYSLFLIIVMTGQVMFVHVYADNYTIASSNKIEENKNMKAKYYPNWNKA